MPWQKWPGAMGGSEWRRDRAVSCARAINLIPTQIRPSPDGEGTGELYLKPTLGISVDSADSLPAPMQQVLGAGRRVYAVAGDKLYLKVDAGWTDLGTLSTVAAGSPSKSQTVTMAWLGPQAGLVAVTIDGQLCYYDERNSTLHLDIRNDIGPGAVGKKDITGADATTNGVIAVAEFQNYFVTLDKRNQIAASPVLGRNTRPADPEAQFGPVEEFAYDLTNFVERSLTPDPWIAVAGLNDLLLLYGSSTMEAWQLKPNPGTTFPLQQAQTYVFNIGCIGQNAIAAIGDNRYWVGRSADGALRAWAFGPDTGGQPKPISTKAMDEWLGDWQNVHSDRAGVVLPAVDFEDVRCIGTSFDGQRVFAVRSTRGATWCYDDDTRMWHERGEWSGSDDAGEWLPWSVGAAVLLANGNTLAFEYKGTYLGVLSGIPQNQIHIPGHQSRNIRRQRILPVLTDPGEARILAIPQLKVVCGNGFDANLAGRTGLGVSRDSGATFGPTAWLRPLKTRWSTPDSRVRTADGTPPYSRIPATDPLRWTQLGAAQKFSASIVFPDGSYSGGTIYDVLAMVEPMGD